MAAVIPQGPVKVTLEMPNGLVHEITGQVVEMSYTSSLYNELGFSGSFLQRRMPEFELTVRGVDLWFGLVEDKADRDQVLRLASEWRCDYCQQVNPRDARYCGELGERAVGCGAHRSFIYEA